MALKLVYQLKKLPPVTRIVCLSLLTITAPVYLGLIGRQNLVFTGLRHEPPPPLEILTIGPEKSLLNWEVWRLYTSFFLGGSCYESGLALTSDISSRSVGFIWGEMIFL